MRLHLAVLPAALVVALAVPAVAYIDPDSHTPLSRVLSASDTTGMRRSIQERAMKVSNQTRANADRRLAAAVDEVDRSAKEASDGIVCKRIAEEIGLPRERLEQERLAAEATWGELMIATTIAANTRTPVAARQLVRMHKEGMSWSEIAAGLGLALDSVVAAMDVESAVARGRTRADGRVAMIRGTNARGAAPGLDSRM